MVELEKTFLAKALPPDLDECPHKVMMDIYYPAEQAHCHLRLRRRGDKYEITKKYRLRPDDCSSLVENTIELTQDEFAALAKAEGKRLKKLRYYLDYNGKLLEVDVFQDALRGLVLIDVEFSSEEEKDNFVAPDFCLAEVTQDSFLAGGVLCGKTHKDIGEHLKNYEYSKL